MPGTILDGLFILLTGLIFVGIPLLIRWTLLKRKRRGLAARNSENRKAAGEERSASNKNMEEQSGTPRMYPWLRNRKKQSIPSSSRIEAPPSVSEMETGVGNGVKRDVPLKYLAPEGNPSSTNQIETEHRVEPQSLNVLPPDIIGSSLFTPQPRALREKNRLHSLSSLQAAVVWREILGPPKGLEP